jgi:acid phosphatase type 7
MKQLYVFSRIACLLAAIYPVTTFANDTLLRFAGSATVPGSVWKYLDNGSNQGAAWRLPGFNDAVWASGGSELGYGDGDENTLLNAGCTPVGSCSPKFVTTYFRKTINIPNPASYTGFGMSVKRDDGIIIYVNGLEVYANNIASGASYTDVASNATDDGEAILLVSLPTSTFAAGNNTIAVEIHQSTTSSSDITFDMQLVGLTGASLTRGPYLQAGTMDSITIRWRTDVPTDSKVSWGTVWGTYPNAISDATLTTEHIVRIGTLQADTRYYYTIGGSAFSLQSGADNRFTTLPPTNTARKLRFLALGDCGNNSSNQVNVKNAFLQFTGSNDVDALILLGDNAYSFGTDAEYQTNFFDVYKNDILKFYKLYPAPGNHDYGSSANTGLRNLPYHTIFTMPRFGEAGGVPSGVTNYYSFNVGDVHFISLDSYGMDDANTTKMYDTAGAQATWLKADLAANTKRWTVAYFHHPPYTKTSHTSDTELDLVAIRERFVRILERYGVDLVLCGHSHGYERSYLLKGYYNSYEAPLYDADFNAALHTATGNTQNALYNGSLNSCAYTYNSGKYQHGTVYTVSGSAGQLGGTTAGYPHDCMHYSNATNGGSLYIEVDSNRLDAKFISYDGAIAPVVRDQFTIFKDVNRVVNRTVPQNAPLTLTASWRGTYLWPQNGNATTQSVNPSTAAIGTFPYIVRDNNNCLKDSFSITVTTPLAVQLLRFDAMAKDRQVLLQWVTTQETNSRYFTLEHATDGQHFTVIAQVAAAGNSNATKQYATTHNGPLQGNNYYRLSQTDINGQTVWFDTKQVMLGPGKGPLLRISQLGQGQVLVLLSNVLMGKGWLQAIGSDGRLQRQQIVANGNYGGGMARFQLPPGFYSFKLVMANGQQQVATALVQ